MLATTLVGRVLSIFLSICSILIIAVVPGVITSYYVESTKLRADESSAKFLDDLEHLPELSKEELVELSEKVKSLIVKVNLINADIKIPTVSKTYCRDFAFK